MRFAHHRGFRSRCCRPYRAKIKGKLERPIPYLRENFFYGRQFLNDADLDAQLSGWLQEVANVRVHGTTAEKPLERFRREELAVLDPLAATSYLSVKVGQPQNSKTPSGWVPRIEVERRPLEVYRQLAGESA